MNMTYQVMDCTTHKCGSCRAIEGEAGHNKYQQKLCDDCSEMYQQIYWNNNGKQVTSEFCNRVVVQPDFEKASQHKDRFECS